MKNTLLKSLLKAKEGKNKEAEELIDSYLAGVKRKNKKETEAFVSDLLVFIMQNTESMDKEVLLELVQSKISHLGYSADATTLEEIYEKAAAAVAASLGTTFTFGKTDAQVLDSMYRALTWMKEDGAANTQDKLKTIIGQAMEGEINMADLGETLRESFEGVVDESARYFEGVSDHIIRQSQSVTRAYQFEEAGVKEVKVVAVIDKRTSAICRSMHGRIIPIKSVTDQADAITAAQNIEEKKKASRWQSKPIFGTLPKDVALPPYHFRCRTIVVAYFSQSEKIDGKNVNGSLLPGEEYKGSEVLYSHKDNFGYERVITKDTFGHNNYKHNLRDKDVIAGLNSLESVAMHSKHPTRTLAYSRDKKLFYVFEDEKIVTVFEPNNKEEYFKERAESATIQSKSVRKEKEDA